MSDPNTPDPMDRAYAQAEARLDDEAARAARRVRVLAAVAAEPVAPPAPKPARRWGGWLMAAGVAGLGVLLTTQLYLPTLTPPRVAPKSAASTPAPQAPASALAPSAQAPQAQPPPAAEPLAPRQPPLPKVVEAAPIVAPAPQDRALAPAPPPLAERAAAPAPPPTAGAPAPPAAASSSEINEVVVTAEKRAATPATSAFADRAARTLVRLPAGHVGQPYPSTRVVEGGTPDYVVDRASRLPPGLSVTPAGMLEGVPTQAGTTVLTIVVHDSAQPSQTLRARFQLVIEP